MICNEATAIEEENNTNIAGLIERCRDYISIVSLGFRLGESIRNVSQSLYLVSDEFRSK